MSESILTVKVSIFEFACHTGEIRVGFYQERRGNKAHSGYVHLHCLHHARPHADIGELNSIDGFEKLTEHDRLLLAKFFAGEKVLASEFSSIVTRQRSASPQLKRGRSASPAKAEGATEQVAE
jgi:hypothetical protein